MCGGSKSSSPPKEKTRTFTPNPNAVADTSNDYAARRGAVVAATSENPTTPSTFGAELGGS
jgi:hypothetical protein